MANWKEIPDRVNLLLDALDVFDWAEADAIVEDLISRLRAEAAGDFPEDQAKRALGGLRRKRRFRAMGRLAEALILSGVRAARIRRQFAQALIDQDQFAASEFVLRSILEENPGSVTEKDEARGLLGRIFKQWHLNPGNSLKESGPAYLVKSFEIYREAFDKDRRNYWHGINACALAARGRRHGIAMPDDPNPQDIANQVLESLRDEAERLPNGVPTFAIATAVEAYVALGDRDQALVKAGEYIRCKDADAFEFSSTLRNLVQVWELTIDKEPGAALLPILRAAALSKEGGGVSMETAQCELNAIQKIAGDPAQYEAILGDTGYRLIGWYKRGLERCQTVARIETRSGTAFGTGWLISGGDLSPKWAGQTLLLTNKHVLSPLIDGKRWDIPKTGRQARRPEEAVAHFQAQGVKCEIEKAVWTSPDERLDTTLVALRALPPNAAPLVLDPAAVKLLKPPSRVYVIGYPLQGDLAISLEDNRMVDCDDMLLQYRAPTEQGSSGSPVFEHTEWMVIALHHAGSQSMKKLSSDGFHPANEGILIQSLRKAIATDPSVR